MKKGKDLVEYAFDLIWESTNELEEMRMWSTFSIAEQLAQDFEINMQNTIELTDKQYKELLEKFEELVKKHESEIDDLIENYIEGCQLQQTEWRFA